MSVYLASSMCIGVRIISTKTAPETFAMISSIRRFKITITTPLRQWKHTRKHSALFGNDNGSTSCKPSQDVSKRTREQIQPITSVDTHPVRVRCRYVHQGPSPHVATVAPSGPQTPGLGARQLLVNVERANTPAVHVIVEMQALFSTRAFSLENGVISVQSGRRSFDIQVLPWREIRGK